MWTKENIVYRDCPGKLHGGLRYLSPEPLAALVAKDEMTQEAMEATIAHPDWQPRQHQGEIGRIPPRLAQRD